MPNPAPHSTRREFLGASLKLGAGSALAAAGLPLAAAMQTALSGGDPGGCEPLDWLGATTPRVWRIGGQTVTYHWEEPAGASPLRI